MGGSSSLDLDKTISRLGGNIKKQTVGVRRLFSPDTPDLPTVPKPPKFDAATDAQLRRAHIARIRLNAIRGTGRQATVATSQAGVVRRAATRRTTLTGV